MRSCSASYESRSDLSRISSGSISATRRASSAITALLKAVASARALRRIGYCGSGFDGRHCGGMALVPAGAIGRRGNILCAGGERDQVAAAVSDCSAMAARCTTVNSVVTVISSERDVIIVKALGLRLGGISFLRLLSLAGVVALTADHLDLVDAHFQRGSFPPSRSCHSRRLTSPDTATCVPLVRYCASLPPRSPNSVHFVQIVFSCRRSRRYGDREFEYLSACRQIPGFCVSPKAPCEAPNIQAS